MQLRDYWSPGSRGGRDQGWQLPSRAAWLAIRIWVILEAAWRLGQRVLKATAVTLHNGDAVSAASPQPAGSSVSLMNRLSSSWEPVISLRVEAPSLPPALSRASDHAPVFGIFIK